ncbi:MAG: molybdopterin-dependent oxidoreductase [Pyrinomonadaceae bacterium]
MNETNEQSATTVERQSQTAAANIADTQHPSHYEATKQDIKTEPELRAQAIALANTDNPDETTAAAANDETNRALNEHGDAAADVRAGTPEEFTGLHLTRAAEIAGGIPAVLSTIKYAWREMGAVRSLRTLLRLNQKSGFDCMSCAWPDPDGERAATEFCENGAKAVAEEATARRVTPEFFKEHSVAELSRKSDYWLGKQGRITHPMILREGATHYELVSWDDAFKLIANELNALHSPDEAIFYTSGRTSNEAAFLYQLFVRQFGTNNLPDCSNMCHESSGSALTETIGVGKGTVTLQDFDTVEAIKAMHARAAKVFFAMGGNFLSASPDTEYTACALQRLRLTVQVSTKLNRGHLITGTQALILPCLGRTETDAQKSGAQFVSTENSMGVVQQSRGTLPPASTHLLSEPAIVAKLARAVLGERSSVEWENLVANYDHIRDAIGRPIPGFDNYNERVRLPGGFYLPNLAREGRFLTDTNRANFTVHEIPRQHLAQGQFVMMTIRSHDQFNTTIYGLDDRYRGIYNERRVVLLNAEDIAEQNLRAGQIVDLTSYFEGETRTARRFIIVPYQIPRRCAATYFPETNVLVPIGSVAEKSNTPTSKYVIISVQASIDAVGKFDYDFVEREGDASHTAAQASLSISMKAKQEN